MSEEKKAEDLPLIEVVYIGERKLKGSELASALIPLAIYKDGGEGSLFTFKRGTSPRVIGAVYHVRGKIGEGGALDSIKGELKFLRLLPKEEDRTRWEALSNAAETIVRAKKIEAKMDAETPLSKTLEPLKIAMRHTDYLGRAAIKALVLAELDKW
jgi:hypothetical protein